MDVLRRMNKWRKKGRSKSFYPDVSCKDAPVPPELPVTKCDCGKLVNVDESRHPDTAARAYYTCGDSRVSEHIHMLLI